MNISHLQISVINLVFMILYTFALCVLRTEKFVMKESPFIFGFALTLWLLQLINGIVWVSQTSSDYIWCLLFWQFIPSVFLFGIAVLVSQDASSDKDIAIRKDSLLAKVLDFFPINVNTNSLCSFSWSSTFIIFVTPFCVAIAGSFFISVSVFISLFTLRDPVKIGKSLVSKTSGFEDVKARRFKNGLLMSPFIYLVPLLGIWEVSTSLFHKANLTYTASWIVYLFTVSIVYALVIYSSAQSHYPRVEIDDEDKPVKASVLALQSLKSKVCPRIYLP